MTTNKLLSKLKIKAFDARQRGMLPKCLVLQIYKLGTDTAKVVVEYFAILTQHFMRIEGYYNRFPEADKIASEEIEKDLKEKGYLI